MSGIAQNDTTGASLTGPSYDVCVCLDGVSVNMLIDTGSVVSLLPEDFVKKHFDADRILSIESLGESHKFITASGDVLPYLGVLSASVSLPCTDRQISALFLVTPSNQHSTAILGTNILELIDPNEVVNHKRLYGACTLVKKHSILKVVSLPYKKTRFPANTVALSQRLHQCAIDVL